MVQLDLTAEEVTTLLETLQSDQADLRMEIADTDNRKFKDQLKVKKAVMQSIVGKLEALQQKTAMDHSS